MGLPANSVPKKLGFSNVLGLCIPLFRKEKNMS